MIDPNEFEINQFRDGSLVLSCGKLDMETDLVFASGAMNGDPLLEKQREILEFILAAVKSKTEGNKC